MVNWNDKRTHRPLEMPVSSKVMELIRPPTEQPLIADWVFAYGSLIWNPEINFEQAHVARVYGFHRNFCIQSTKYRGTPSDPGVVLGLDQGGSCIGIVYKLVESEKAHAIERLYEREMINHIYRPILVDVHLHSQGPLVQKKVSALTFAANRSHDGYLALEEEQLIHRLKGCSGERGPNKEYAINTWLALKERGVSDRRLKRIAERLL
jgi:glutathione-specific gamma-glutamylcyclotransferase